MKKYNNFCITWNENGTKNEQILFCKLYAIKTYMELLTSNREISSLSIFGVTRLAAIRNTKTCILWK